MFNEINLFDDQNKDLRNCFLFFFAIAVCSYLSIIVSSCPHNDDWCRYLANINVGTFSSNRYLTFLLECFIYFSSVITDAAPFSHVLSCIFLAYGAVVCLRIFDINLNNKLEIACFVPIVANPYMFEIMLFRFDNPFSTLAFLFCITAAYLSAKNSKKLLLTQTGIFFLSLFMYQPASSAYFIIGTYKFLEEIREGRSFFQTILKMRYWIYTLLISIVAYIPFTYSFNYCVNNDGSMIAIPSNAENINTILKNIEIYYSNLIEDWSGNMIGNLVFLIFIAFVLHSLTKIKNFFSFWIYLLGACLLTLCPFGACVLLKAMPCVKHGFIMPRCIFSIGILVSGALYGASLLFKTSEKAYKFYIFIITCLCFWNIVFLNSTGNIVNYLYTLQRHVLYDVSKDVHEIREKNKNLSGLCFTGSLQTYAMNNFAGLYPIIYRIVPAKWHMNTICQLATIDYRFADSFLKHLSADKSFDENKYKSKKLSKSASLYDIFIWDEKVIQVHLKSSREFKIADLNYATIGEED